MCVGCGTRAPQANLLRFRSRVDGALVVVAARQQAGRTAYLHRQRSCWERFASRGGPLRSLRRTVDKPRRRAFVHEMQAAEQCAMVTEHGA
jgi:predicted RNA-binding protein YlxR (DUF448 family)